MNNVLLITFLIFNLFYLPCNAYAQDQGKGLIVDAGSKKLSIDYREASLISVLQAIAYSFNLNLVITKDVQGKVSAYLQNITIDEALNAILSVNGYKFIRKGDIIYVLRANDVETVVEPFHLSFLTAIEAKQLLSKTISKQGDIQVNEATNSLVIVDVPENIVKIRQVLSQIDVAPIQVLIEAKIVDIETKDYENLGTTINSNFDTKGATAGSLLSSTGGPSGSSTGSSSGASTNTATQNIALGTNLAGPSTNVSGDQISITPAFKNVSLNVQLDALIQQNKAHVLASPSIATLNGKEAKIVIGEHYPYLLTTQTTVGNIQTSTQFIDVGTTLKVTPMVSPDGWITMKVHPEVSSVSEALAAGPRITTQEADSTIRVRDNETIIIGGLINKIDNRTKSGIPFLRSIPIIGWLFSNRSSDKEDTELTVFITPHIVRASSMAVNNPNPDYANKGDPYTQDSMFAYIETVDSDIDKNKPNESDLFKYSEIVQAYQSIYRQFPDSPKADYCLLKVAQIYSTIFHKPEAAKGTLKELLKKYPKSPYRQQAHEMLKAIQKQMNHG
jgi:type IV pilus assembly protein PilQ